MQFLWKYVDDLIGKGLEWYIVTELLFYASANLVTLALPLAILLSSIMTFGNLGEHYELVAMKSSGLSLQRIMFPLILITAFTSMAAFYFSNNIQPIANLKFGSLLYDITHQKPAIDIKEGIFYNGIDGYTIRVAKKENNGNLLKNIMIYDHTSRMGSNKIIIAASGTMGISSSQQYMVLTLNDGYSYDEQGVQDRRRENYPLLRYEFQEQIVRLDLTGFKLTRSDEELFKDNYAMLNVHQLQESLDELDSAKISKKAEFNKIFASNFHFKRQAQDTIINKDQPAPTKPEFYKDLSKPEKVKVLETALTLSRNAKMQIETLLEENESRDKYIYRHKVEWHRKFTLSFACMVLFFIGAPLGAIIRKGGLGMPVVVSVIFFVIFHVLSITGEKFAKEGIIDSATGMWMASSILLPVGIFLTYKATRDSAIFDTDFYLRFTKKFKKDK